MSVPVQSVDRLLSELAAELRPVEERIRTHAFVAAVETGSATLDALRAFATEQEAILRSDHQSFHHLTHRFPHEPGGALFRELAEGELAALAHLERLQAALGLGSGHPDAYALRAQAQAYPGFVARLALQGSRLDVTLAFLVNLDAWGANCVRLGQAVQERYGLDGEAASFFAFFAPPGPELRNQLRIVAAGGLAAGDDPAAARESARLLQAYELLFWDSLDPHEAWSA